MLNVIVCVCLCAWFAFWDTVWIPQMNAGPRTKSMNGILHILAISSSSLLCRAVKFVSGYMLGSRSFSPCVCVWIDKNQWSVFYECERFFLLGDVRYAWRGIYSRNFVRNTTRFNMQLVFVLSACALDDIRDSQFTSASVFLSLSLSFRHYCQNRQIKRRRRKRRKKTANITGCICSKLPGFQTKLVRLRYA